MIPTPEASTPATPPASTITPSSTAEKSQRVLACVLCQQRKVKCNRQFPCKNCIISQAQCVPAALVPPRPRRRRFAERELLDRLQHYENLLHQNNVEFESMHKGRSDKGKQSSDPSHSAASSGQSKSTLAADKSETVYKAKNFWHAMTQTYQDSDDEHSSSGDSSPNEVSKFVVNKAWNRLYQGNDHLLFSFPDEAVDLSMEHPEHVQIFRLWQIYLDNVNPLLKVTHTLTLQGRIIEAASDLTSITHTLTALMFSIYCVAIMSLDENECNTMFGSPKDQLLAEYQLRCRQALLNCGYLRSSDRECLTALFLYLISIRPSTHPRSLTTMFSIAMHTAQQMGLHNEATNMKFPVLEAEMRRRLWWSLVLFDTRICEMSDYKCVSLNPTWDCKFPSNINDFELNAEMKELPAIQGNCTEAIFTAVRGEIGNIVRHSEYHLDFSTPSLKAVAKEVQQREGPEKFELGNLERTIEEKYLRFYNPGNPLHFMTTWMARSILAKMHLFDLFSKLPNTSAENVQAQRNVANLQALKMLECDTTLAKSPLAKGYMWFINFHFPGTAYIHLMSELRRQPISEYSERCWDAISENFEVRFTPLEENRNHLYKVFVKLVLQAWEAREVLARSSGEQLVPPQIISFCRSSREQSIHHTHSMDPRQPGNNGGMEMGDNSTSVSLSGNGMLYSMGGQGQEGLETEFGQETYDFGLANLDWDAMD